MKSLEDNIKNLDSLAAASDTVEHIMQKFSDLEMRRRLEGIRVPYATQYQGVNLMISVCNAMLQRDERHDDDTLTQKFCEENEAEPEAGRGDYHAPFHNPVLPLQKELNQNNSVMNTSMQSEPEMRKSQGSRKSVPFNEAGGTLNIPRQSGEGRQGQLHASFPNSKNGKRKLSNKDMPVDGAKYVTTSMKSSKYT